MPAEKEIELCLHPHLVFKLCGVPVSFVIHREGEGLILEILANRDQRSRRWRRGLMRGNPDAISEART